MGTRTGGVPTCHSYRLEKPFDEFERFIADGHKSFSRMYRVFPGDFVDAAKNNCYRIATFTDDWTVGLLMTDQPNPIFLWKSKKALDDIWQSEVVPPECTIF